ncbi:hypothetical protein BDV95DRAFT_574562 [Massariosphaeria phaeospora]|uniref:Uncharacterized protein n=1 Tax=Massariosphaeria phaeospora TaxID=100035 RepID=A0A7C8M748_9PLEO|nr:hypothetical protein BDV95DRAFT_574562 [Massariosphaeria phaeospora]
MSIGQEELIILSGVLFPIGLASCFSRISPITNFHNPNISRGCLLILQMTEYIRLKNFEKTVKISVVQIRCCAILHPLPANCASGARLSGRNYFYAQGRCQIPRFVNLFLNRRGRSGLASPAGNSVIQASIRDFFAGNIYIDYTNLRATGMIMPAMHKRSQLI